MAKKNNGGKGKGSGKGKSRFAHIDDLTHAKLSGLMSAYVIGITPELYEKVYKEIASNKFTIGWLMAPQSFEDLSDENGLLNLEIIDEIYDGLASKCLDIIQNGDYPTPLDNLLDGLHAALEMESKEKQASFKVPKPLKNAYDKTIKLKIKMRGITKPPVWREVEMAADSDFFDLHDVIQAAFGWNDYHLWQFMKSEFDSPFAIRLAHEDDDFYDFDEVRLSPEIELTSYLRKKGDKLLYQYDYGDDWIHEISVVEITDGKCPYPQVVKAKGDMMIEDVGGVDAYMAWRHLYTNLYTIPREDVEDFLNNFVGGMEEGNFISLMEARRLDIDRINAELKNDFDISDLEGIDISDFN